jgi:hypothetical protein
MSKVKINTSLYENKHPKTSLKGTGYANKEKALFTLKLIKEYDITYQKQVVLTMYNRAKFHKYQTEKMLDAMKIYKKWLKANNVKT